MDFTGPWDVNLWPSNPCHSCLSTELALALLQFVLDENTHQHTPSGTGSGKVRVSAWCALVIVVVVKKVNVPWKYTTNLKLSFPSVFFSWPQASIVTVIQLVNNVVDTIENEGTYLFFSPIQFPCAKLPCRNDNSQLAAERAVTGGVKWDAGFFPIEEILKYQLHYFFQYMLDSSLEENFIKRVPSEYPN